MDYFKASLQNKILLRKLDPDDIKRPTPRISSEQLTKVVPKVPKKRCSMKNKPHKPIKIKTSTKKVTKDECNPLQNLPKSSSTNLQFLLRGNSLKKNNINSVKEEISDKDKDEELSKSISLESEDEKERKNGNVYELDPSKTLKRQDTIQAQPLLKHFAPVKPIITNYNNYANRFKNIQKMNSPFVNTLSVNPFPIHAISLKRPMSQSQHLPDLKIGWNTSRASVATSSTIKSGTDSPHTPKSALKSKGTPKSADFRDDASLFFLKKPSQFQSKTETIKKPTTAYGGILKRKQITKFESYHEGEELNKRRSEGVVRQMSQLEAIRKNRTLKNKVAIKTNRLNADIPYYDIIKDYEDNLKEVGVKKSVMQTIKRDIKEQRNCMDIQFKVVTQGKKKNSAFIRDTRYLKPTSLYNMNAKEGKYIPKTYLTQEQRLKQLPIVPVSIHKSHNFNMFDTL